MRIENFEIDPSRQSSGITSITRTPGYDDIFNDIVYYPNKYIMKDEIALELNPQINSKQDTFQTKQPKENNIEKTKEDEIIKDNPSAENDVVEDKTLVENYVKEKNIGSKLVGFDEKTKKPIYSDTNNQITPNNNSSQIGNLFSLGINDCMNFCNGNCVEHGISGNAYCFVKIPKPELRNFDRLKQNKFYIVTK